MKGTDKGPAFVNSQQGETKLIREINCTDSLAFLQTLYFKIIIALQEAAKTIETTLYPSPSFPHFYILCNYSTILTLGNVHW